MPATPAAAVAARASNAAFRNRNATGCRGPKPARNSSRSRTPVPTTAGTHAPGTAYSTTITAASPQAIAGRPDPTRTVSLASWARTTATTAAASQPVGTGSARASPATTTAAPSTRYATDRRRTGRG